MSGDHSAMDIEPAAMLEALADAERRLSELEHELERSHRLAMLGTLMASIAHEYNNILTPMMSYAQMALAHPEDGELMHRALQRVAYATERAARVSSSILGFARGGESEEMTHVAHALTDALACLAREPARDGVELTTDIPADAWVRMSPVALQHVLMNLILNAKNAMRPRGGRIRVSAERSTWNTGDGDAGSTIIRVADTGPGIPEHIRAHAFDAFVRSDPDNAKRDDPGRGEDGVRGTGLGLAVCRRLVDGAGGTIDIESSTASGTTVRIRVPSAPVPATISSAA